MEKTPIQQQGLPTKISWERGYVPTVSTYLQPLAALPESSRTAVRASYEDGGLILFPSPDLPLSPENWAFIDSIKSLRGDKVQEDKRAKKAKMRDLLAPFAPGHVFETFGLGAPETEALQTLIVRVNDWIKCRVRDLFPRYKIVGGQPTWRFTETGPEGLHYDSYGVEPNDHHHVRVFVNLDTEPRKWKVSMPVTGTICKYRNRCSAYRDLHPNLFNAAINFDLPWEEMPRAEIDFSPGTLWMVNSQIIAHEIVQGRKMAAFTFQIDPATMDDPSKHFVTSVRAALGVDR